MALDLSLPALVNSGGALLFAAVGVFALALARTLEERLVAALAIAFGAAYVVQNLWPYGTPGVPAAVALVLSALVAVIAVVLGLLLARGLPARLRNIAFGLGILLLASTSFFLAYGALRVSALGRAAGVGMDEARLVALGFAGFATSTSALAFMVSVSALTVLATPPRETSRRRALALHACAYAIFAVFTTSSVWPIFVGLNAILVTALVPVTAWATTSRDALGRRVTLALVAAGIGGVSLSLAQFVYGLDGGTDFGSPGILRAIGAFLLALAILRHGLVGERAHPLAARQGPLTLGALVALFIVAEVAQNFLSAQYGLLIGGIIAGALLVAARPIERALEGRQAMREPDAAKEEAFRAAVRMALRDRTITREEEVQLHRVAQHMGIPTGRAHELLVEVEKAEQGKASARMDD